MDLKLISLITFILYITTVLAYYKRLRSVKSAPILLFAITSIALSLHGYTLYKWIDTPFGQNLNWANMVSLVAWLIACLTLMLALIKPIENLMILILPIASLSIPLALTFNTPEFYKTGQYPSHLFHILSSMVSFGILGMAGFQAMMLQIQHHTLRTQPKSALLRLLPPIETMETVLFQMILLGFLCLSLALCSAIGFANDQYSLSHWHKIVLSLLAWAFFAILLYKHYRKRWRGKTAVRWTLGGFGILLVAYFSSKLVLFNNGFN